MTFTERLNEVLHLGLAAAKDRENGVALHPTDPVHVCETACTHVVMDGWTALGIANVMGRRDRELTGE